MAAWQIRTAVIASYKIENQYTQLWQLADKSSTIPDQAKIHLAIRGRTGSGASQR